MTYLYPKFGFAAQRKLGSLIVLLCFSCLPLKSEACTCPRASMEQQFNAATFVFSAWVIGVELEDLPRTEVGQDQPKGPDFYDWKVRIRFDPVENFKGNSFELPYIRSNSNTGTCGFTPNVAHKWIFFVDNKGHSSRCSGNIPWGGHGWMKDFNQRVEWLRSASKADQQSDE